MISIEELNVVLLDQDDSTGFALELIEGRLGYMQVLLFDMHIGLQDHCLSCIYSLYVLDLLDYWCYFLQDHHLGKIHPMLNVH